MNKTKKHKNLVKGWKNEKPGYHQRTVMFNKCGKKCFLGPKNSYPICKKNTCKISSKGVHAAYIRSRQYKRANISRKAKHLIKIYNL